MPPAEKTLRAPALPALSASVDPARFVAVSGERIALLGRESGPFECWIWPLKIFHDFTWVLRRPDDIHPLVPERRELSVAPGELVQRWKGNGFDLRTEIFACPEKRGLALCFTLESAAPLELELSFQCDFRPMWPAGLGGQLAWVDRTTRAFALGEELGRFVTLIGAPGMTTQFEPGDRGLPEGAVKIQIPFNAGGSSVVVGIAGAEHVGEGGGAPRASAEGAEKTLADAHELWWRLVSDWSSEREELRARWTRFLERTVRLATGEHALDDAFQWSKLALERAWTSVEGVGRGLVAGLGPSGTGERPGRAWFFDAASLAASRALSVAGDVEGARMVLRSVAARARADGALARETTLSGRLCKWIEDHPFAFSGDRDGPDFVAALEHHVRGTGDLELARELWPTVERVIASCSSRCDEHGLLAREKAALETVRGRPRAARVPSDVALQGAWLAGLQGAVRLAEALGTDAAGFQELLVRASNAFESFWSEKHGRYAFTPTSETGGDGPEELAAAVAGPLARGFGSARRAWTTVQALGGTALARDWGVARFAANPDESSERSAVSMALTSEVARAHFAHGNALVGQQTLFAQAAMFHFGGLGLLEERFDGEKKLVSRRGLPHSIAAAAGFVEAALHGLFGLEIDAPKRRLVLRPSLPFAWDQARIENLAIGETRLDLAFYRRRRSGEQGETLLGVTVEHRDGPSLQVAFAPILPPLSLSLDGPIFVHPSGAVVPRRSVRGRSAQLALETRVLEGPALLLPRGVPARGEPSRAARLVGQEVRADVVRWTLAAPAGTLAQIPFQCDRTVEVAGATLVEDALCVPFDAGSPDEWKTAEVYLKVR